MTNGAEKSPEQGFDLEKFKDEFYSLVEKYTDAMGENSHLPQGEHEDTETPRKNILNFYVEAKIPQDQMNAVIQAVSEILFGVHHRDERLQKTSLEQRTELLKKMTEARLKKVSPEIPPENYRNRIAQLIADLG